MRRRSVVWAHRVALLIACGALVCCSLLSTADLTGGSHDAGGVGDALDALDAPDGSIDDAPRLSDGPAGDRLVADTDAPVPRDGGCGGDGGPAMVYVDFGGGFCIDSTEVTAGQYAAWLGTNPRLDTQTPECAWNPSYLPTTGWPLQAKDVNLPVVGVDWCDAYAYCKGVGKRLCGQIGGGSIVPLDLASLDDPSVSQWMAACSRGGTRPLPYGQLAEPSACNSRDHDDAGDFAVDAGSLAQCQGGYPGIFDMSGNVSEWEDSCDPPDGSVKEANCHLRGGEFYLEAYLDTCAFRRGYEDGRRDMTTDWIGFRCCSP